MSYLHPPRLNFAGQFQADVPTVNNDPAHFDSRTFWPAYQLQSTDGSNGWWNPAGSGAFRLLGCAVRSVVYADGSSTAHAGADPVIGAAINDAGTRVEGKMVDLDPEQQGVSEIWGFQVALTGSQIGAPPLGFQGEFEVAAFADLWPRYAKGTPDSNFSAFYQSVLQQVEWHGDGGSRFLRELSGKGKHPERLSIRFVADGMNQNPASPTFLLGRIVGSIGLWHPGEPHHFIAGRVLSPAPQSPLHTAYGRIEDNVLWLDLGNSLPTSAPGGPAAACGKLFAAILPARKPPVPIGLIEYEKRDWYSHTAGIVGLPLTAAQLKLVATNPLGVVKVTGKKSTPLLAEAPDGIALRADQFVFRFNPPGTQSAKFYATKFGQPAARQPIALTYDDSVMKQQTTGGPIPGPQNVGQPQSALTFPKSIAAGPKGVAELPMTASDPGNPRGYIDGQVYGITYAPGDTPPRVGSIQNPSQMLSALVFSGFTPPEHPVWLHDIHPIFQQYANLYPVMRPIVDLSNYASVMSRLEILKKVFDMPESHPNYMPVTRDLSHAKREMIRRWLRRPTYMSLDSPEQLIRALQLAVRLEHSTIPPYLCALYSIKDGINIRMSRLIQSIVVEEMFHMAQASNLLVSIGGTPEMDDPAFVPRYPGPMPAGLRAGLHVRLRRCSLEHIRDVFMRIEEPEKTYESFDGVVAIADPSQKHPFTLAWFYHEVERALVKLSGEGKIRFRHAARQVSDWKGAGQLQIVTSLEEARAAIHLVVEQGEGCKELQPGDPSVPMGHYFKFAEIVEGKTIVPDSSSRGFAFAGDVIPFDPDGVWPMIDDPGLVPYPSGSRAALLAQQFSRTYHGMLQALHRTFSGHPDYLRESVGMMYSLELTAKSLMQTPSGLQEGTTAGPVFSPVVT